VSTDLTAKQYEHHFILKYTELNGWQVDADTEQARFPKGTVWDSEKQEWTSDYLGNQEYIPNSRELMDNLVSSLELMNGVRA
jgi:hypothetical protein